MRGRLILKNYRSYSSTKPAAIEIESGVISFVGANNSGKSNILKSLYELRQLFKQVGNTTDAMGVVQLVGSGHSMTQPMLDVQELINDSHDGPLTVELRSQDCAHGFDGSVNCLTWQFHPEHNIWRQIPTLSDNRLIYDEDNNLLVRPEKDYLVHRDSAKIDVSSIRTLAKNLGNAIYIPAVRNAVNEGAGSHYDLQLGTSFVMQWDQWKNGGTKAQAIYSRRITEDVARLLGVRALEINASSDRKTLRIIIDGRSYQLAELGAGIAQLIVVIGHTLINPSIIAIDEPETHLHPALQIDFINTLASYSSFGVWFSTHSIGLARAVSDICYSVYAEDGKSVIKSFEHGNNPVELLGSLGIAGLRDIGWDTILLVEGTTDVRTFQSLLRLYELDRRTIIIPLGGSSLITKRSGHELAEIVRLGAKTFAIVDSEKKSPNDLPSAERQLFKKNCERLGICCLLTERRATENYFSDNAVKQALGSDYQSLLPYQKLGELTNPWGKNQHAKIARKVTREDLINTDLGVFLQNMQSQVINISNRNTLR